MALSQQAIDNGFPPTCSGYQFGPPNCPHAVTELGPGDGIRCDGCRCFPDHCTCGPGGLAEMLFSVLFGVGVVTGIR